MMTQRRRRAALVARVLAVFLAGCQTLPGWMVVQGKAETSDDRHFDNAPVARAASPRVLPKAPKALRWSGGRSADEVQAWAQANGTQALLVRQRGQVVCEGYFNGFARASIGTSCSVAKSLVSALIGIAISEGGIADVDQPITRCLPELLGNDPRFAAISVCHLQQMRSGIAFDQGYDTPFSETSRFYLGSSLAAQVTKLRTARPPGHTYLYQSGDTQLLAMSVARAVRQPIAAYAQAKLWQPKGAEVGAIITRGSSNVFAGLGVADPEAHVLKAGFMTRIRDVVNDQGLTQTEAAKRPGLSQPDVSRPMRGQFRDASV